MKNPFVPTQHRPYVAAHPLALWLSLGIAFVGAFNLLFPGLSESSASLVYPGWLLIAFNVTWLTGGAASAYGLLRGKRRFEAAGMSLLSGGMATIYVSAAILIPYAWATSMFVLFLAIGCALRARALVRTGYVNLEIPVRR
jgi:hypothetical protein